MAGREENVYLAKLSEQAERYDEMVEAMKLQPNSNNYFNTHILTHIHPNGWS
jgi:allantoicase